MLGYKVSKSPAPVAIDSTLKELKSRNANGINEMSTIASGNTL